MVMGVEYGEMVESRAQNSREAGVLLHVSSLPGGHGIGDLGEGARSFVHWLSEAGMKIWQVLPLVPVGPGDSPYSTTSAFASNPLLIDLAGLVADGLLDEQELKGWNPDTALENVDYDQVRAFKEPLLSKAASVLLGGGFPSLESEMASFMEDEPWVHDVALFHVLKEVHDGRAWWDWSEGLPERNDAALRAAREAHAEAIATYIAIQFFFERQWGALADLCREKGISLVGDLPIYVAADSADVWTNPDGFLLNNDFIPEVVSGVPPDAFSATGQLWGNPLYDWDQMASDGYAWWKQRLGRVFRQTPRVRIDHFRAFSAYWSIPAHSEDARSGEWIEGPGMHFFNAIFEAFGRDLPIIAEDLGMVDEPVYRLVDETGFPGMKVLQFAFDGDGDNLHLPHKHPERSVVYTGTHDNDTLLGWWFSCGEVVHDRVRRYLSSACYDAVQELVATAFRSAARTAIIPMQDVLALDSTARMNTPSVGSGNWAWRMPASGMRTVDAQRLSNLARETGRL